MKSAPYQGYSRSEINNNAINRAKSLAPSSTEVQSSPSFRDREAEGGMVSPSVANSHDYGGSNANGGDRYNNANGGGVAPSSVGATSYATEEQNPLDLHELAKGWKAAIARARDPNTAHEAKLKNDRGNLPLHSAASFRAPIDVAEALLEVYPEAASLTNNYGNLALHFTAWKKGPLDVERLLLHIFPEGAAQRNNHGNLPLHYAAHYNAPIEVVEALYNAYPEAALQKNNDDNTPLDLAIADGASPNVVALLQGKMVPPGDDEALDSAKFKVERVEKELQSYLGDHENLNEDLEDVIALLMDVKESHPHALYSAGIDPDEVEDENSMLEQIRKAGLESSNDPDDHDGALNMNRMASSNANRDEEDIESLLIEDALIPPDDAVENVLSKIIGLDPVKNQIRGLRRTLEIERRRAEQQQMVASRNLPRHLVLVGNPGTGKTFVARRIMPVLHKIGAVTTDVCIEVGRDELVDPKSCVRTIAKTRKVLERARGGVLFIDEAYTLLPSKARKKGRDHGAAALREIARILPGRDPLVIMAGYSSDLQLVVASDIGFKGNFLLQIEFPDQTSMELARIFLSKVHGRGFVPGTGLTAEYLAELIKNNTDVEWRSDRNGRVSEQLLLSVLSEIKRKTESGADNVSSKSSLMPLPGSKLVSQYPSDDIVITVEDVHNAIVNGF